MDVFTDWWSLALGDILLLLEDKFAEAERKYHHADVNTDQEEDTKEWEDDANTEKTWDEEDDHDLLHGELVETEASLDDQSEQAKIEQLLRESCGCQLGPHGGACSSAFQRGNCSDKKQLPPNGEERAGPCCYGTN